MTNKTRAIAFLGISFGAVCFSALLIYGLISSLQSDIDASLKELRTQRLDCHNRCNPYPGRVMDDICFCRKAVKGGGEEFVRPDGF